MIAQKEKNFSLGNLKNLKWEYNLSLDFYCIWNHPLKMWNVLELLNFEFHKNMLQSSMSNYQNRQVGERIWSICIQFVNV